MAVGEQQQTPTAQTLTPDEYARLIAEDRHLAVEFAQLSAVNDTAGALQVVAEVAADILGRCIRRPTRELRNLSVFLSLKAIEHVGQLSEQRGDEIQAAWCTLIHHQLLGGEWPSA